MNKIGYKKGFGLIEVLLASLVIITVTLALMYLSRTALSNMVYTEQHSQATYLAQEAIEMVRQARDTNYIDGASATNWSSFVESGAALDSAQTYHRHFRNSRYLFNNDTASGKVRLGNTEFDVWISFKPIGATDIMKDPKLNSDNAQNNIIRNNKVYDVEVTAGIREGNGWGRVKVTLNELITDSRQGF